MSQPSPSANNTDAQESSDGNNESTVSPPKIDFSREAAELLLSMQNEINRLKARCDTLEQQWRSFEDTRLAITEGDRIVTTPHHEPTPQKKRGDSIDESDLRQALETVRRSNCAAGLNINQVKFDQRLQMLVDYIGENGHYRVPRKHPTLGVWMRDQRGKFRKKKKHFMESQYPQLQAIGVDFAKDEETMTSRRKPTDVDDDVLTSTNGIKELDFDCMYEKLKQYRQEHGDANVPHVYKADPSLGNWVRTWRTMKKTYDERILKLDEETVAKVSEDNNDGDNGSSDEQENTSKTDKLRWIKLTKERIEKLDEIDFQWVLREKSTSERKTFDDHLNALQEYYAKNGNFRIRYTDGRLGKWFAKQRYKYEARDERFMRERYSRFMKIGCDLEVVTRSLRS